MPKNPALILVFSFFLSSLFPLGAIAKDGAICLRLEDETGKELFSRPLHEGQSFAIRFIHSVALSPVTDFYKIKNGEIYLDKTVYHDFGAGLPHNAEDGQKMRVKDGDIILEGFNRRLPEFDVRVGRVAKHTLLVPEKNKDGGLDEEIPLASLASPGSALHFTTADCGN